MKATISQKTYDRIVYNAGYNRTDTVIGRYTYRLNKANGEVRRCKTEDIGREWITADGQQYDGWTPCEVHS